MENQPSPDPQAVEEDTPMAEAAEDQQETDQSTPMPEAVESEPEADQSTPMPEPEETKTEPIPSPDSGPNWARRGILTQAGLAAVILLALGLVYLKLDDMHASINGATDELRASTLLDQRAWIAPVEIDAPVIAGSPVSINIKVVNSGKTFARKIKTLPHCLIFRPPSAPDMAAMESQEDTQSSALFFIAPGQQYTWPAAATGEGLPKGVFDAIQAGQTRLFIYGKITYDDIFKRHHRVAYCYVYEPKTSRWTEAASFDTDDK
jgi:hypothetical protein